MNNQALPGVTVDYTLEGIRLGSVVTGSDGMVIITPRYGFGAYIKSYVIRFNKIQCYGRSLSKPQLTFTSQG